MAGGRRPNQDHVILTDHSAVVLDGATSWLPQDPARDGGWYARTLGSILTDLIADDARSLTNAVSEAIHRIQETYALDTHDSPTSTVTIARWSDATTQIYTLGDSPAVVYLRSGAPQVVFDGRLEAVGAGQRTAYREYLRSGAGYDDHLGEMIADLQRIEHSERNTEAGYWIAESSPSAAIHGVTAEYPSVDVSRVLLLSDGASAAVTDYGLYSWGGLMAALETSSAASVLRTIHGAEAHDQDGVRWPRAKRHDDKTVVLVEFGSST
jgi:hypothetical protein